MAQQVINVGSGENAGDGESLRSSMIKINGNAADAYAHIADRDNPHAVTAAQVGAVPATALATLVATLDETGKLAPAQAPLLSLSGDLTGAAAGGTLNATLAATGVSAGTYTQVVVDATGRVTDGLAAGGLMPLPGATLTASFALTGDFYDNPLVINSGNPNGVFTFYNTNNNGRNPYHRNAVSRVADDGSFSWGAASGRYSFNESYNGVAYFHNNDASEHGNPYFMSVTGYSDVLFPGNVTVSGTFTGTAAAATALAAARTISLAGDASGGVSFDGSSDVTLTVALAGSVVAPGTYTRVVVDATGRVTSGSVAGSYACDASGAAVPAAGAPSDHRLKQGVAPLAGALDRLLAVPVRRYQFIAAPDVTLDGFLAHELQPLVPQAVSGAKDAVDANGAPVYQSVDKAQIVPLLAAATQELKALVDGLRTELRACADETAALRADMAALMAGRLQGDA